MENNKQISSIKNLWNKSNWSKLLIILFFPFFLVFAMVLYIIESEKMSGSRKSIIITCFIIFMILTSSSSDKLESGVQDNGNFENKFRACERQKEDILKQKDLCLESKETVTEANKEVVEEKQIGEKDNLTKDEAMAIIQNYKITVDLEAPKTSKGTTILEYYERRGKLPAITSIGWFTEEIESGKYLVSYKQKIGDLENNPRWEVTKNEIKALNGVAITITPEFGPQLKEIEAIDSEKQIHAKFSELYKKYEHDLFETNEFPTVDQLDFIEERALSETAIQFNISSDKVVEIFSRLESQRYSQ